MVSKIKIKTVSGHAPEEMKMTPYQFAKRECANFNNDGSCLGVKPEDLVDCGQRKLLTPRDKCVLYGTVERCRYFEEIILPLADKESPVDEPGLQFKRMAARDTYYATRGMVQKKIEQRVCEYGALLEKRKRVCSECRARRRRETKRKHMREIREGCGQLTAFQ